ncbi:hypothetical protein D0Z00_003205 [Geotrichum galactomycetum]|uniref:Uncharacterized protein n=1 Tax=Geotrichum galactomycetum TaxID=27317 RepID=A0ACB6V216_9ASCO|nr:hypothetical protein D0Z00_003205 [Geotrichum candidum]
MSGNLKSAQPSSAAAPATSGTSSAPLMASHSISSSSSSSRRSSSSSSSHRDWTSYEDNLIQTRTDLSIQELSLLLPQCSEAEINDRRNRLWHYAQQQQQQQQQFQQHHHHHQHSIACQQQQQQLNSNYTTAPAKRPSLAGRPANHKSAFDGLRLPLPVSQKQNPNRYLVMDQQKQPVYQYYP